MDTATYPDAHQGKQIPSVYQGGYDATLSLFHSLNMSDFSLAWKYRSPVLKGHLAHLYVFQKKPDPKLGPSFHPLFLSSHYLPN